MKATRLTRMVVKNVAAVDRAANKRTWLLLKSESGDPPMAKAGIKSENERRRLVDQGVRAKWGSTTDWSKAFLDDIWDGDEAIVCKDGEYYATPFTIDAEHNVSFGDMKSVTRAWVAKRQQEIFETRKWSAAEINNLPDHSFAVISAGGQKDDDGKTAPRSLRHLAYKDADGSVDSAHLRHAFASLHRITASDAEKAQARTVLLAAAKEAGIGQAVEKMEAMTFDDAMMARRINKVYMALGEHYGALMETLTSIRESDDANKGSAMKDALSSFMGALKSAMPKILAGMDHDDDEDMEKVGRKISMQRLAKLKALHKTIAEIIAEQETEMAEKKAPDASALAKFGAGMAAMFARMTGADDATVSELEKQASGQTEPEIPAAIQALMAKANQAIDGLKTENDTLKTELKKANEDVAKLRNENDLRKFADEVAGYKEIGLEPAKDAALLKAIDETLPKEMAERIRELWKAQLAQKAASGLFKEVGSAGAGQTAATAAAELEQKIGDLMSKNDKLDRAAAVDQVYRAHPGLYDRVREETNVRV